ncbi:MAG: SOS response-associated peptidase [Chitinophagaceae bacterium]|nr:SOS response-associated peptidase [Chitinophagaceae bacterium]
MCYYNGIRVSFDDFIRLRQLEKAATKLAIYRPMQSGFEYKDWPVIKPVDDCEWEITPMEWGFLPPYLSNREAVKKFREGFKDEHEKYHPPVTTLNAIGEELLLPNKMYKAAALSRRCLIFSSGFYEWRHVFPLGKQGKPLKTAVKYPYHITVKNAKYFFMAGVWQTWTDKETGETVDTFAVVTTAANSLMEQIHNSKKRMPTILPEALAGEWISDGLTEKRITELATYQYPAENMEAYTISKDFRTATDATQPFNYEELEALT